MKIEISNSECGISTGSIVGGSEATPFSIPWQIGIVNVGSDRIFCGGTLVSSTHVLTAAHCMVGEIEVIVGEHDVNAEEDGTRHEVCGVTLHPNWNSETTNYDYAMLRLKEPVQIGNRAVPVCLADSSLEGNALDNKAVTVSGWGKLSESGSQPTVLHTVNVQAMSNSECQESYGQSAITDAMLCAGQPEGEIDSCQGDSGGMLSNTLYPNNFKKLYSSIITNIYHICTSFYLFWKVR